jgi:hypothetical protein
MICLSLNSGWLHGTGMIELAYEQWYIMAVHNPALHLPILQKFCRIFLQGGKGREGERGRENNKIKMSCNLESTLWIQGHLALLHGWCVKRLASS